MMPPFAIGDRVRVSAIGRRAGVHLASAADRVGTVAGHSRDGFPRVQWDGLKTIATYHPDYVERHTEREP